MGRHYSHLASAVAIIDKYDGSMPFNNFIKAFFSKEKKYGSKDRKSIASLCYAYFRSGQINKKEGTAEKIITAYFLNENSQSDFLNELRPDLNDRVSATLAEKLEFLNKADTDIFPFKKEISPILDAEFFIASLFIQPALYLRIRPGKQKIVRAKLSAANILFDMPAEDCVMLPNGTKAEDLLKINVEAVVQDRSSQRVLDFVKGKFLEETPASWDCCAASGGKSILLFDRLGGKVRLTVTDIRENILSKLHTRLHNAGIKIENSYLADLTQGGLPTGDAFDIIICDVPCTGSGTWSRTPEQMFYFQRNKIDEYATLQKNIIGNVIPSLNKTSLFLYITCSVFHRENEAQVDFIQKNHSLKLLHKEYVKGYHDKADTMFVAVFKNV